MKNTDLSRYPRNSAEVNSKIKHTGLWLYRYPAGYCAFYRADDHYEQVGDSVMIYAVNRLTLAQWIATAEAHAKEHAAKLSRK